MKAMILGLVLLAAMAPMQVKAESRIELLEKLEAEVELNPEVHRYSSYANVRAAVQEAIKEVEQSRQGFVESLNETL